MTIDSLLPIFAYYARYYARYYRLNADDLAGEMALVFVEKAASVVHRCGPLLAQSPAYIAKWAARYGIKRLRQWQADELDEAIAANPPRASSTFPAYLEQIGREWGIDVSAAIEAIGDGEVSPAFESYIRELGPEDKRIAALLLSGLRKSHINAQRLAPRRKTRQIHREIVQILKAA
jgi:hypothetical protein